MSDCPKDADTTESPNLCRERINDDDGCIFICTRKKGHNGKHHAHGPQGSCCKVW